MKRGPAHIAKRLRLSGSFIQPVLTLVSGIAIAQAVVFAARPLLARLFTPDEFGVLTLFVSLVAVVASLATGHYDDAGLLPESREDAAGLFSLAFALAALSAVALTPALLWQAELAVLFKTPELENVLLLLPAGVLLVTWGQIGEGWHSRHDHFALVSAGRFAQSCTVVAVQIGTGLIGAGALGLTGGVVLGFSALVLALGMPLLIRDREIIRASLAPDKLRTVAKRYRRFPLFSTPAAFLNLVASRIAIFLLAAFFGPTTVGLFGLAFGTLALPVGMITGAIGQVFGVRAPVAHLKAKLGPLTEQVYTRLLAVALFPMATVAVAGPDLFALVFGEPWREAGVYARILAPWLFAMSVASPLTRLFDVTERQRDDLGFSVLLLATQVVALAIAWRIGVPRVAVAAVAVAGTITRCAQIAWMLRLGETSLKRAFRVLSEHLLLAVLLLSPAALLTLRGAVILWVLLVLLLAACAYTVAIVRMDWRDTELPGGDPRESTET